MIKISKIHKRLSRGSFYIFLVIMILNTSCNNQKTTERPTPEVEHEQVKIIRFEQLLCKSEESPSSLPEDNLLRNYPIFTDVFFNQVIAPQNESSIKLNDLIINYCNAPAIQHLIDTTTTLFPDLNDAEQKFGQAFGYFHYYFPDRPIPKVFTYVSEFGIGTFTIDTRVLAIGLDFFLGKNYPYYDPAIFPQYLRQTMSPEYMVSKAVSALAQVILPSITTGNMLDHMIFNGKIIYLTSRFLPREPMDKLNMYTKEQMEWIESNELNIWSYLLDLGYFYESDQRRFKKFIDPAPTTPGLPEQAPGRVANWIGYRIVESYMNKHPEVTLREMAANTDFQNIMDQSKYKPPRPR